MPQDPLLPRRPKRETAPAPAPAPAPQSEGGTVDLWDATDQIAQQMKVPRAIWQRMVHQESGGNTQAIGIDTGRGARARSAWQVMPATARNIRRPDGEPINLSKPLDAAYGGLKILADNYATFKPYAKSETHAWMMAIAGYHGNPANVLKDLQAGGDGIPDQGDGLINTRDHVYRIFQNIKEVDLSGATTRPQPTDFQPLVSQATPDGTPDGSAVAPLPPTAPAPAPAPAPVPVPNAKRAQTSSKIMADEADVAPASEIPFEPENLQDKSIFTRAATGWAQFGRGDTAPAENDPDKAGRVFRIIVPGDPQHSPSMETLNEAAATALGQSALNAFREYKAQTGRDLLQIEIDPLSVRWSDTSKGFMLNFRHTRGANDILNAFIRGGQDEAAREVARQDAFRQARDAAERAVQAQAVESTARQLKDAARHGVADAAIGAARLGYNAKQLGKGLAYGMAYGADSLEYQAGIEEERANREQITAAQNALPAESGFANKAIRGLTGGVVQLPLMIAAGPAMPAMSFVQNLDRGPNAATAELLKGSMMLGAGNAAGLGLAGRTDSIVAEDLGQRAIGGLTQAGFGYAEGQRDVTEIFSNLVIGGLMPTGQERALLGRLRGGQSRLTAIDSTGHIVPIESGASLKQAFESGVRVYESPVPRAAAANDADFQTSAAQMRAITSRTEPFRVAGRATMRAFGERRRATLATEAQLADARVALDRFNQTAKVSPDTPLVFQRPTPPKIPTSRAFGPETRRNTFSEGLAQATLPELQEMAAQGQRLFAKGTSAAKRRAMTNELQAEIAQRQPRTPVRREVSRPTEGVDLNEELASFLVFAENRPGGGVTREALDFDLRLRSQIESEYAAYTADFLKRHNGRAVYRERPRRPMPPQSSPRPQSIEVQELVPSSPVAVTDSQGKPRRAQRALFDAPAIDGNTESALPVASFDMPRSPVLARASTGRAEWVVTPSGVEIETRFKIVPADAVKTSWDEGYNQSLQPRRYRSAESRVKIRNNAVGLDPERMGANREAGSGAPIIGSDGMAETRNHGIESVRMAYRDNLPTGKAYREFLLNNAESFGLTRAEVEAIPNPLLVRERVTPLDDAGRVEFAINANERTSQDLDATTRAAADAKALVPELLGMVRPGADGSLDTVANLPFIRAFLERVVSSSDMPRFSSGAQITQDGLARVRNALMVKALGDTPRSRIVIDALVTSAEAEIRNLGKAIQNNLGALARLEHGTQGDNPAIPPALRISEDLAAAAYKYLNLRRQASTRNESRTMPDLVSEYLSQGQLFIGRELTPEAERLLEIFGNHYRSGRVMSDVIGAYADVASKVNVNQLGLFGGEVPSKIGIIEEAYTQVMAAKEGKLFNESNANLQSEQSGDVSRPQADSQLPEPDSSVTGRNNSESENQPTSAGISGGEGNVTTRPARSYQIGATYVFERQRVERVPILNETTGHSEGYEFVPSLRSVKGQVTRETDKFVWVDGVQWAKHTIHEAQLKESDILRPAPALLSPVGEVPPPQSGVMPNRPEPVKTVSSMTASHSSLLAEAPPRDNAVQRAHEIKIELDSTGMPAGRQSELTQELQGLGFEIFSPSPGSALATASMTPVQTTPNATDFSVVAGVREPGLLNTSTGEVVAPAYVVVGDPDKFIPPPKSAWTPLEGMQTTANSSPSTPSVNAVQKASANPEPSANPKLTRLVAALRLADPTRINGMFRQARRERILPSEVDAAFAAEGWSVRRGLTTEVTAPDGAVYEMGGVQPHLLTSAPEGAAQPKPIFTRPEPVDFSGQGGFLNLTGAPGNAPANRRPSSGPGLLERVATTIDGASAAIEALAGSARQALDTQLERLGYAPDIAGQAWERRQVFSRDSQREAEAIDAYIGKGQGVIGKGSGQMRGITPNESRLLYVAAHGIKEFDAAGNPVWNDIGVVWGTPKINDVAKFLSDEGLTAADVNTQDLGDGRTRVFRKISPAEAKDWYAQAVVGSSTVTATDLAAGRVQARPELVNALRQFRQDMKEAAQNAKLPELPGYVHHYEAGGFSVASEKPLGKSRAKMRNLSTGALLREGRAERNFGEAWRRSLQALKKEELRNAYVADMVTLLGRKDASLRFDDDYTQVGGDNETAQDLINMGRQANLSGSDLRASLGVDAQTAMQMGYALQANDMFVPHIAAELIREQTGDTQTWAQRNLSEAPIIGTAYAAIQDALDIRALALLGTPASGVRDFASVAGVAMPAKTAQDVVRGFAALLRGEDVPFAAVRQDVKAYGRMVKRGATAPAGNIAAKATGRPNRLQVPEALAEYNLPGSAYFDPVRTHANTVAGRLAKPVAEKAVVIKRFMDVAGKRLVYDAELGYHAERAAAADAKAGIGSFKERYKFHLDNPSDAAFAAARTRAGEFSFGGDEINPNLQRVTRGLPAKLFAPTYLKFFINLSGFMFQRNPLFLTRRNIKDFRAGGDRRADAIGRWLTGVVAAGAAYGLGSAIGGLGKERDEKGRPVPSKHDTSLSLPVSGDGQGRVSVMNLRGLSPLPEIGAGVGLLKGEMPPEEYLANQLQLGPAARSAARLWGGGMTPRDQTLPVSAVVGEEAANFIPGAPTLRTLRQLRDQTQRETVDYQANTPENYNSLNFTDRLRVLGGNLTRPARNIIPGLSDNLPPRIDPQSGAVTRVDDSGISPLQRYFLPVQVKTVDLAAKALSSEPGAKPSSFDKDDAERITKRLAANGVAVDVTRLSAYRKAVQTALTTELQPPLFAALAYIKTDGKRPLPPNVKIPTVIEALRSEYQAAGDADTREKVLEKVRDSVRTKEARAAIIDRVTNQFFGQPVPAAPSKKGGGALSRPKPPPSLTLPTFKP